MIEYIRTVWGLLLERLMRRGGFARARIFADKMVRFMKPGDSVIDIGSGTGHIAALLYTEYNHRVQMYDVVARWGYLGQWLFARPVAMALSKRHWIPYQLGRAGDPLPFENRSFTTALLAFSMHHAEDAERVFKEAARVTKNRIIVFEDIPQTAWEEQVNEVADRLVNVELGPHPHQNRTHSAWRALFLKHGFRVMHEENWVSHLHGLPFPNTMFVLERD